MKITTQGYQLSSSITLTVSGAGVKYSVDLDDENERLDAVVDLLDAACEILGRDIQNNEILDRFHDNLIDVHDNLHEYRHQKNKNKQQHEYNI